MNQLKRDVLHAAKRMYREALVSGSSGNVSAYDPEKKLMAITPSGMDYDTMTADDIVVMEISGKVVSGKAEPSSEWRMHALFYEERGDVKAVVHTHSPYATGFAVLRQAIPLILIEMVPFLGGDIPLADFAMPGSRDLGKKAMDVLDERFGCLLTSHGALAIGASVAEAYLRAVYIEDAAKIYFNAVCTGGKPYIIPDEIARQLK